VAGVNKTLMKSAPQFCKGQTLCWHEFDSPILL
jgi:hypothetical protein